MLPPPAVEGVISSESDTTTPLVEICQFVPELLPRNLRYVARSVVFEALPIITLECASTAVANIDVPLTSSAAPGLVVPKTLLEGDNRRMEKGDCELYLFEGTKLIKAWLQLVI